MKTTNRAEDLYQAGQYLGTITVVEGKEVILQPWTYRLRYGGGKHEISYAVKRETIPVLRWDGDVIGRKPTGVVQGVYPFGPDYVSGGRARLEELLAAPETHDQECYCHLHKGAERLLRV